MVFQEGSRMFTKQQDMCQESSTNHKATSQPPMNTEPVKFSLDTKRLQHMNRVNRAPVGAQIKRVIDLLLETRQALTPEQIKEACYVDIKSNETVFISLKNNPRVTYDGTYYAYKPKHDVKDKNQLLGLIRAYLKGISVVDFKDAYPTVMEDLQALKAEGLIWLLSNFDSREDIAYPNDPKVLLKVDDDLKLLFRAIKLPQEMIDIEKDLQKNGMKPATNTVERRNKAHSQGISIKPEPKKKRRKNEISKRTKLTNSHLPEFCKYLTGSGGS